MALPANYAIIRVAYGSDQKNPFINTLHLLPDDVPGTPFQTSAQQLADAADAAWRGDFRAVIPSEGNYYGTHVALHIAGVVYDAASTAASQAGLSSGDQLPDYAAVVIRKRSDHPGKTGRGRWFIGCVPEGLTNTNTLTTGGAGNYADLAQVFFDPITAAGVEWTVQLYSRHDNALYPIVVTQVQTYLRTQRRRRLRQP